MKKILIVDDEPAICWSLKESLQDDGHEVRTVPSVAKALGQADYLPDCILLDVRMPGKSGIDAIADFRQAFGDVPIIMMTAFGDLNTVVRATNEGVFEYLTKPFDLSEMSATVTRALSASAKSADHESSGEPISSDTRLVGRCPAMQRVFKQIAITAPSNLSVLILGETGTGKDCVAYEIHRLSNRAQAPLVTINVSALNLSVIESELFGHVRGAFTGATQDRTGLFELAHGGTIFLDEIAEIPLAAQVKLLRVLETGRFSPVGSIAEREADVRVIAATNRNVEQMIRQGQFREDLYHRLAAVTIVLPPLRDRGDDLELLAEHFVRRAGLDPRRMILPTWMSACRNRSWTGNVRELRNAIEYSLVVSRGQPIDATHLPPPLVNLSNNQAAEAASTEQSLDQLLDRWAGEQLAGEATDLLARVQAIIEPTLIKRVLQQTGDNRSAAAKILGIDRATLREKMKQFGIQ